jgi:hypothetical protein
MAAAPTKAWLGSALAISCIVAGCGLKTKVIRAYPGAARDRSELAVIQQPRAHVFNFDGDAGIVSVDGVPVNLLPGVKGEVELEPGAHMLEIDYSGGMSHSTENARIPLEAQPGRTYRVRVKQLPDDNSWDLRGRWTAWVVDLGTDAVVAGHPPPATAE